MSEMEERFEDVYERLVDETQNLSTLNNERKNHLLKHLLNLCEYLRGDEDTNPLDVWFDSEKQNSISSNDMYRLLQTEVLENNVKL